MNDEMENDTKLKKAIIKMIVFFDIFDYPLTILEIWQNLEIKCELIEIMAVLENKIQPPLPPLIKGEAQPPLPPLIKGEIQPPLPSLSGRRIENKNGFYFLPGREKIIKERLERYNFANRKFKKARLVVKIFKFIPWIKMIGVGSFGSRNLRDNGDIDLFIITDDKRIWLTRFFCIGIIKLLGLRPRLNNNLKENPHTLLYQGGKRDKICLSFYASLSALNLEKLRLGQDDLGFTYWLAGLTLLYDVNKTHQKFVKDNQWLADSLPNWQLIGQAGYCQVCGQGVRPLAEVRLLFENAIDLFISWLEQQFKTLQLKILPEKLKSMMNRDSRVVINDQIIKLHANDRREEYIEKYLEKIRQINDRKKFLCNV
ncbi:hypothetical protein KKA93_02975 [Patescibacteria group bacterium]|nr:hypothetical protein [Patescibacteria group bacterium]